MMNVLGGYLEKKEQDESSRNEQGIYGIYARSHPSIQFYNHVMHKLETLSAEVLNHIHQKHRDDWVHALGPFRRQMFGELYNQNHLVRAFAREIQGFPQRLPDLDGWALGEKTYSAFSGMSGRLAIQPRNVSAPLELLRRVRTVILVDDSGSMYGDGHTSWADGGSTVAYGNRESRWQQARRILASVAPQIAQYSPLGLDIHFLNRPNFYVNLRTSAEVEHAFDEGSPNNGTPTGQRMNDILDAYMSTLRYERSLMPLNLMVITDGEAEDRETLHWAIEEHVTKIMHRGYQAHQFGIEFVQVGDCPDANRHLLELEEEVDRHHRNFNRDVVGVTPASRITYMNPDAFLAIALSGIDARINGYMRQRGTNY